MAPDSSSCPAEASSRFRSPDRSCRRRTSPRPKPPACPRRRACRLSARSRMRLWRRSRSRAYRPTIARPRRRWKKSPASVNVPPLNLSAAPLATVNVPAVDVPPPSSCSVPVCTDTAPVLVRATWMSVVRQGLLLQRARVDERVRAVLLMMVDAAWKSKVPPTSFWIVRAADRRPVDVDAELNSVAGGSVDVERAGVLQHASAVEGDIGGAGIRRRPCRASFQFRSPDRSLLPLSVAVPETISVPAPAIVPPVCVREAAVAVVATSNVPAVTIERADGRDRGPADIHRAACHFRVPAPPIEPPDSVNVPPSKSSVAPLTTANVPPRTFRRRRVPASPSGPTPRRCW